MMTPCGIDGFQPAEADVPPCGDARVSKMGHVPRLQSPSHFEFDVVGAGVEQPPPSADQDRHEMDLHLIE
jgi:hypothetical protein